MNHHATGECSGSGTNSNVCTPVCRRRSRLHSPLCSWLSTSVTVFLCKHLLSVMGDHANDVTATTELLTMTLAIPSWPGTDVRPTEIHNILNRLPLAAKLISSHRRDLYVAHERRVECATNEFLVRGRTTCTSTARCAHVVLCLTLSLRDPLGASPGQVETRKPVVLSHNEGRSNPPVRIRPGTLVRRGRPMAAE